MDTPFSDLTQFEFLAGAHSPTVARPEISFLKTSAQLVTRSRALILPVLDSIDDWLVRGGMRIPEHIRISASTDKLRAEVMDGMIEAPIFVRTVEEVEHSRVIFAHEYGHATFDFNAGARFQWAHDHQSIQDLSRQYEARVRALEKNGDPELLEKTHSLWMKVLDREAKMKGVINPYDEFFADCLAVMLTGDGRSVENASRFLGGKNTGASGVEAMRDFTIHRDLASWDFEGPYALLNPTKELVWNRYLSQPGLETRRPELLRGIFEAVGSEITERMALPELRELNPRQINERLIKLIATELKAPSSSGSG